MIGAAEVFAGIALPAGAGWLLGLGARRLPERTSAAWAGAALLLAAVLGQAVLVAVQGGSLDPARQGFNGIFWGFTAGAAALAVPAPGIVRGALVAVAAGIGWWQALSPLAGIAPATAWALGGGLALATVALGAVLERTLGRPSSGCGLASVTVALAIAAACIAAAGSLALGQAAGTAAAAAGGLLLAWITAGSSVPGLGWAAAVLLVGHVGNSLESAWNSLTWPAAILLALALPGAVLGRWLPVARSPRMAAAVCVIAVVLVAGAALAWTLWAGQPSAAGATSGY